jgi:hypothetical protein
MWRNWLVYRTANSKRTEDLRKDDVLLGCSGRTTLRRGQCDRFDGTSDMDAAIQRPGTDSGVSYATVFRIHETETSIPRLNHRPLLAMVRGLIFLFGFLVTILTPKVPSADNFDISYIWRYITFVCVSPKFNVKKHTEEIFHMHFKYSLGSI